MGLWSIASFTPYHLSRVVGLVWFALYVGRHRAQGTGHRFSIGVRMASLSPSLLFSGPILIISSAFLCLLFVPSF